jgi:hypothetical protein
LRLEPPTAENIFQAPLFGTKLKTKMGKKSVAYVVIQLRNNPAPWYRMNC